MRPLVFLIAGLALNFTPAFADNALPVAKGSPPGNPAQGGMHTIYNAAQSDEAAPTPGLRTLNYVRAAPAKPANTVNDDAGEAVWQKYKALAAGQPESTEDTGRAKDVGADAAPAPAAPPPVPATGFASILQDYKKNKQERSQMHTLTVSPPVDMPAGPMPAPAAAP